MVSEQVASILMNVMGSWNKELFDKSLTEGITLKIELADGRKIVTDIVAIDETAVSVRPYCLYGNVIHPTQLLLSDIVHVRAFHIKYNDPLYADIRAAKIAAMQIREAIDILQR